MFRMESAFSSSVKRSYWLVVLTSLLFVLPPSGFAESVTLAWDEHPQEVGGYRLYQGTSSGNYSKIIDVNKVTTYTVSELDAGAMYYFALTAYDPADSQESGFSNEVSYSSPTPTAVKADFDANPTSGPAPLTVTFTDTSTGNITDRSWDFGDGSTSTGQTAVKSYTDPGTYTVSLTVTGTNGSDTIGKTDLISVTSKAPVADFSADPTSGPAPLTVTFTDTSTGNITDRSWDFGDGSTSTDQNPTHIYTDAGTYTVALTVTDPSGSNTKFREGYVAVEGSGGAVDPQPEEPNPEPSSLQLETGEIELNEQWQRVVFTRSLADPVVVAKPLSANDPEPAVVRIRNVDSNGFDIRIQEWEYLDQLHGPETVGYLAMERGTHVLDDGTQLEAGRFDTNGRIFFDQVKFDQGFSTVPVVVSAVTSFNESDAVAGRMRNVSTSGFEYQLQEQAANRRGHRPETVSYIAWEPSSGSLGGVVYEVNRTANVGSDPHRIEFQEMFPTVPAFLADMQTRNGRNTANLRWQNKDSDGIEVYVSEEQSRTRWLARRSTEKVGYMLFSRP